ncbi:MAG TPA: cell division protein ZapE [Steroidobacteraceae bacterium]|nr:cell division protein ZapE [Steroidobacteraceae bacterium]
MRALASAPGLREIYAREATQRGFEADPAQLAVVAQLDDLRRRLIESRARALGRRWRLKWKADRTPPERGIYLWGAVGRGKTWLMDLFVQSLPFPETRRRHFHRFMHDVHAALREATRIEDPLDRIAERIAQDTRVLCCDEFAVTDIADAVILGGLLAGLMSRGVCLVATSNVRPTDLYADGLQRQRFLPAIELIEHNTEVVELAGATDYRLRRLTHAGTYLAADAPDTARRLTVLFEALVGDHPTAAGSIEIEGRAIPVVRRGDGVVWFEFLALCSSPRGTDDYIEIAREFGSVIVANVPVLDATQENEARRFIALVDELYDRNVNLIVSARAAPADLYRGERLALEFRRTSSRLIEMQSGEYLAREHRP